MKIAFLASNHPTDQDLETFIKIIDYLVKEGHAVSHALAIPNGGSYAWDQETATEYFAQFYAKLSRSDIVIAECSNPTMQLGYEIASSIQLGKEVIILKQQGDTKTIQSHDPLYMHKNIYTFDYTNASLLNILKIALDCYPEQKFKKYNIEKGLKNEL